VLNINCTELSLELTVVGEPEFVEWVRIIVQLLLVFAVVTLLDHEFVLVSRAHVLFKHELLLVCVLLVDVLFDFEHAGFVISLTLKLKTLLHLTVYCLLKLAELVLPVLFILVEEASFPLPEGFNAVRFAFNFFFVALELTLCISDQLDGCDLGFVNAAAA